MADLPPIIVIKRIKKGGHGHHGGAWKVAYADFVTAMMAFFLLLWLLSVTTPEKRSAIADYFTPTIGIRDAKGIGLKGGKLASTKKGTSNNDLTAPGIVMGQVQQGPVFNEPTDAKSSNPNAESTSNGKEEKEPKKEDKTADNENAQDSEQFKLTEADINQALQSDDDLKQLKNNVQVQQSVEGLKIDLIDDPKKPMFASGGATLTEVGKKVLDSMANIIAKTQNQIAIVGHTDVQGPTSSTSYTNWELSADRANAARRALATTQLGSERVAKIVGLADRELLVKEEPTSPRNRRITVVLMRGVYVREQNKGQPEGRSILSVGDAKLKPPEPEKPAQPAKPAEPAKPSIFDIPQEAPK